ncbi:Asp23/Gls24 family envelope stress response protein [Candidatus Bipolaricaulota bacterium]|nr:Asp23/Gls24 family envelope stress response protein [Candidatus Bipolaricaulota bacterium]
MAERKVEIVDEDGRITISEDVIAAIARIAAEKVDGIARPSAGVSGGLKSIFGGEDLSPNIKTELTEGGVRVEMKIAVEYGYPVHEVAQGIQGNVQKDIEELAGVTVTGVDVYVKKVVSPHTLVSDSDSDEE